MSHADRPRQSSAFLHALADSIVAALADNGEGVLAYTDGGGEVGILPLAGQAPIDVLLGAVAPDHWCALGAGWPGWSRRLDDLGAVTGDRTAAEVVLLVPRDGEVVGRVRYGGSAFSTPPAHGLTLDCLQRALGLSTAPPQVPTAHRFASRWLEDVLRAASERGRRLSWPAVRELHPAFQLLGADADVATGDLVLAARALERSCDWERLRWLVVEGSWKERNVTAVEAAWFDAGSFSRWVLSYQVPLPLLLVDLVGAVGASTARRCARTLSRLGMATAA